jgi:hypothetical protein
MRKAGKRPQDVPPYIVPLSLQAIEIVRYLLGVMRPAQVPAVAPQRTQEAHQREHPQQGRAAHGLRGAPDRPRHPRHHLDGAQRDRLPKIWVDAQLSHSDPNKVSSAYNHAKYVEPRRRMMQDWADRLDLLEQGEVEAASAHLTIRIDGVPAMAEVEEAVDATLAMLSLRPASARGGHPIVVTPNSGGITFQRLSQVPPPPTHAPEPEVSASSASARKCWPSTSRRTICRSRCSASWPGSPRTRSTAS